MLASTFNLKMRLVREEIIHRTQLPHETKEKLLEMLVDLAYMGYAYGYEEGERDGRR